MSRPRRDRIRSFTRRAHAREPIGGVQSHGLCCGHVAHLPAGHSVKRLSLLAITAHPDDESSGFGGTLAIYARRGASVGIVCATCGEAARNRGGARSREDLCRMRREEFGRACSVLGASWREILDYPDGGLNQVALPDLGVRLCAVIRERKPDVVLSFGPEGAYTGHPDHAAISLFATFAFHAAGRESRIAEAGPPHQAQRLYYLTAPAPLSGYPHVCFSPITHEMDISETYERKLQAFEMHHTQAPLFARFRAATAHLGPREYFHLAAGKPAGEGLQRDLFAGL